MPRSKAVHIVRPVAFQYVGLEQRIVLDTRQAHAVIGEHMHVVFDVLAELRSGCVLKPRFESLQSAVPIELLGHPRVTMGKREVSRMAWLDRQGNTDDSCLHGIETGCFRVHGDQSCPFYALDPLLELCCGQQRFVMSLRS